MSRRRLFLLVNAARAGEPRRRALADAGAPRTVSKRAKQARKHETGGRGVIRAPRVAAMSVYDRVEAALKKRSVMDASHWVLIVHHVSPAEMTSAASADALGAAAEDGKRGDQRVLRADPTSVAYQLLQEGAKRGFDVVTIRKNVPADAPAGTPTHALAVFVRSPAPGPGTRHHVVELV